MTSAALAGCGVALLLGVSAPAAARGMQEQAAAATPASPAPVIIAVMVHGNHTTPDADVVNLAGVAVGQPFTPLTVAEVQARLERSGRFRAVEVRQRSTSFSDPDAVLLVIVVEERAGIAVDVPSPGPLRRLGASTMWLPVFNYEDGYGLTYGARFAFVDLLGRSTRLSVPLTWGGERRASVALERTFVGGPLSRLEISGGTWRREHPPTGEGERRTFGALRVERAVSSWFRLGAHGEVSDVAFGDVRDQVRVAGVDAVADTRRDPAFARNAVYARVAWDRLWFDASPEASRLSADLRGYLGVFRSLVLVGRVQQSSSDVPLPPYEQQYLGGMSSLRGFRLGYRSGDRLTAGSVELRVPITSPVHVGRFGVAVFADRGAVYPSGTPVGDAVFDTGVGGGVFATLPVLSFRVDVAHGIDAGTRVHVSLGARF